MQEAPPINLKSPPAIRHPENKNRNGRKKEKISTPQQKANDETLELANIPRFQNRTIKGVPIPDTSRHNRPVELHVPLTLDESP